MASTKRDLLPKVVKPTHYDLSVFNIDVGKNSFEGHVKIDVDILEDTDSIVLHALDIEISKASAQYTSTKTESQAEAEKISINKTEQTATLKFGQTFQAAPGAKAQLDISYSAKIKNNMNGFYRSDYKDLEGKDQVMLSTQFEATEARTALPCFDEPSLKATFQLTLTVAEEYTALSNTPVLSSKIVGDGKKKGGDLEQNGLKTVQFQQTPVMSTYLLAWAIGKLDYIEAFTDRTYNGKKIPVRIYTQEGVSEQGRVALEVSRKVVDYFSEAFDIDYVLPKLDLISIPSYSHNAMENWGLITFRPTALLFDEKTSSKSYIHKVAYVVSHELAHQWFGNLVTMEWWDELWLNEGYATAQGYDALNYLYPEWRALETSTTETLQDALQMDSLRGSHPVEVPIQNSADIDQVFDRISYLKGSAVINQLSNTIGPDTFLKGVSHYLKKNKFGNATTKDLWSSISEVSKVDVVTMADNWIRKIGFPYVLVETDLESGDVTFTQHRFLSSGDAKPEEDVTLWWIPLNVSTGKSEKDKITITLSERSKTIPNLAKENPFFKINKNSAGFYRVVYDPATLETIKSNLDKLSPLDKSGLIDDAVVTSVAGLTSTSDALQLINLFKGETDVVVWTTLLNNFNKIVSAWYEQSESVQEGLKSFYKSLITPTALSFDINTKEEDFLVSELKVAILSAGVSAGIPEVITQAQELGKKYIAGEEIDPSLRSIALRSLVNSEDSTEQDFDAVYGVIAKYPHGLDTKEIVLGALGSVTNPVLIKKALGLILDPEIAIMDVQFVAYPLSENGKAKELFLEYVEAHYDEIYSRLNANRVVFDRFIKFTMGHFANEDSHRRVKNLFTGKDLYGFERSVDQVLDSIDTNTKWVSRDKQKVADWLAQEKYI